MSTYTIEYLTGKSTDELYRSVNKEECVQKEKGGQSFPWMFPDILSIDGRSDADWSHLSSSSFETSSTGNSSLLVLESSSSSSGSSSPSSSSTRSSSSLVLTTSSGTSSPSSSPSGSLSASSSSTNSSLSEEQTAPKKEDSNPKDKPAHSYIALISMAILHCPEKRLLLGDIYEYIMTTFPYYKNKEKAWRNSIRHNLSLNECFIKNGRAENGKGNYWSIHPACVEDFSCGDFRRRQARRRARKNINHGRNVNDMTSLNYSSNFGYVPMTPSTLPYPSFYHRTNFPSYQVSPVVGPSLYPALSSSSQFSDVSNFYHRHLNTFPQMYPQLY